MYKRTIFNIFNFYAPIKKKYIRPDDASFMLKKKYITITNYIPEASNRHQHKKVTTLKDIFVKNFWKTLRNHILKVLTLKKPLITEVSGGLSNTTKFVKRWKKLKPYQVTRSSARYLINFSLMSNPVWTYRKLKSFPVGNEHFKMKSKAFDSTFYFRKNQLQWSWKDY